MIRDDDKAAWDSYVQKVTPLGQPEPCDKSPPLDRQYANLTLDLHGLNVKDAHHRTMTMLEGVTESSMTIVTGVSGAIRKEFPHWFLRLPHLRIEELQGGGAFSVRFKRKR